MEKIIKRNWLFIVATILIVLFCWASQRMYFHQDDLDWFILANRPFFEVIKAPIGDHVNYLWRILLSIEWNGFGFNFWPYLFVSTLMHFMVTWLLYKIADETTGRKDLAAIVAMLFVVNTNWTESILWISGQTISITALFTLWAIHKIWNKKGEISAIFMSGMTSALALGMPIASLLVYGYQKSTKKFSKVGIGSVVALTSVALIYHFLARDGTKIVFSWEWALKVFQVALLMPINTVLGRLIIPFDRLEIVRILTVSILVGFGVWKYRVKLSQFWKDDWSRFLVIQLVFYNLIVAVGRAQFGVGIMRAERYAYLGLALILLLMVRLLRNVKIGRLIVIVPMILILQIIGFYRRASDYFVRPQQLKQLIEQIQKGDDLSPRDQYLPHFVLNDERLKYGDIYDLIKR